MLQLFLPGNIIVDTVGVGSILTLQCDGCGIDYTCLADTIYKKQMKTSLVYLIIC